MYNLTNKDTGVFYYSIGEVILYTHMYMYIYCIAGNFRVVQNFAIFMDRSPSVKIKITKIAAGSVCLASPCVRMPRKFLRVPSRAILRNFALTKISRYMVLYLLLSCSVAE